MYSEDYMYARDAGPVYEAHSQLKGFLDGLGPLLRTGSGTTLFPAVPDNKFIGPMLSAIYSVRWLKLHDYLSDISIGFTLADHIFPAVHTMRFRSSVISGEKPLEHRANARGFGPVSNAGVPLFFRDADNSSYCFLEDPKFRSVEKLSWTHIAAAATLCAAPSQPAKYDHVAGLYRSAVSLNHDISVMSYAASKFVDTYQAVQQSPTYSSSAKEKIDLYNVYLAECFKHMPQSSELTPALIEIMADTSMGRNAFWRSGVTFNGATLGTICGAVVPGGYDSLSYVEVSCDRSPTLTYRCVAPIGELFHDGSNATLRRRWSVLSELYPFAAQYVARPMNNYFNFDRVIRRPTLVTEPTDFRSRISAGVAAMLPRPIGLKSLPPVYSLSPFVSGNYAARAGALPNINLTLIAQRSLNQEHMARTYRLSVRSLSGTSQAGRSPYIVQADFMAKFTTSEPDSPETSAVMPSVTDGVASRQEYAIRLFPHGCFTSGVERLLDYYENATDAIPVIGPTMMPYVSRLATRDQFVYPANSRRDVNGSLHENPLFGVVSNGQSDRSSSRYNTQLIGELYLRREPVKVVTPDDFIEYFLNPVLVRGRRM